MDRWCPAVSTKTPNMGWVKLPMARLSGRSGKVSATSNSALRCSPTGLGLKCAGIARRAPKSGHDRSPSSTAVARLYPVDHWARCRGCTLVSDPSRKRRLVSRPPLRPQCDATNSCDRNLCSSFCLLYDLYPQKLVKNANKKRHIW